MAGPDDPVAQFLQTVVIMDDHAWLDVGDSPSSEPVPADGSDGEPEDRPNRPRPDLTPPRRPAIDPGVGWLDAKQIINVFADQGLVCAVMMSDETDGTVNRVAEAARRSDLIVLDWSIGEDGGSTAQRVIGELISPENGAQPLRLIAIYTIEPDLPGIIDQIAVRLAGCSINRVDDYTLDVEATRIIALSKVGGAITSEEPGIGERVVGDDELPDRLIDQFRDMTDGMLQRVALAGLAAVRQETHKVLEKFGKHLDPGYLGHRVLLPNPEDAEAHLSSLVSAEIKSLISEHEIGRYANAEEATGWVDRAASSGGVDFEANLKAPNGEALDIIREIVQKGGVDRNANLRQKAGLRKDHEHRKTTGLFMAGNAESRAKDSIAIDNEFAALTSVRTGYKGEAPKLTLGTIVARGKGRDLEYLICLQPACDAIRLQDHHQCPFLRLKRVSGWSIPAHLVVNDKAFSGDEWVRLNLDGKPRDIEMISLELPGPAPCTVTASMCSDGNYYFTTDEKVAYRWVAQLKDDFAQRIANEQAVLWARVGVDESEIFRRSRPNRR